MGRRVLWMLLVLLLGFIWGHSLQNGTASQAESQSVLHLALARWGNLPGMSCLNFYTIRKLAHLTELAALGMVLSGLAGLYGKRNFLSVLFWGACVGTVDEGVGCTVGYLRSVGRGPGAAPGVPAGAGRTDKGEKQTMTRLEQLSRELVDVVVNLGYPSELGELMAQNLGTESTVERMIQYLLHVQPATAEEMVDEMLAICDERDKWVQKKKNEYYNRKVNEWINR